MMYGFWNISAPDRIFCHFGLFFALYTPLCPRPPPLTTLIIKISKTGDIILHMSTINKINKNHMMYDSWDMKHNRQNFFALLPLFPTPLTTKRIKIFKKWERLLEYHHFRQVYKKSWSNAILFLRYGMWDVIIFILGIFYPFTPPNCLKNENIKKMKKKKKKTHGDIIILHKCT